MLGHLPCTPEEFKGEAIDTAELLGKPTTPSQLTLTALKEDLVPLLSGIVNPGRSEKLLAGLLRLVQG